MLSETDSDTSDVPPELPPRTPSRTISTVAGATVSSNGDQRSLRAVSVISTDVAAVPGLFAGEHWTSGNDSLPSYFIGDQCRPICS